MSQILHAYPVIQSNLPELLFPDEYLFRFPVTFPHLVALILYEAIRPK